jgi:Avidin family
MTWLGKWRNQYSSILEITDESNHRIAGTFRTALSDSGFFGQEIAIVGVHQGDCIGLAGGGTTPAGDAIVTYTGLLREGRVETLWYVVADAAVSSPADGAPGKVTKLNWWRSMTTSADRFERVT